ncbi:MAG: hypothetical protein HW421_2248 [Ignavibacteria bacterium]|nr:hypothetical protein [Ignavibacteria bacterium]
MKEQKEILNLNEYNNEIVKIGTNHHTCEPAQPNFNELYQSYSRNLYAYLRYSICSKDIADNIFQETWLALFELLQTKKEIANVHSLLITIASRKFIDVLRKQKNKNKIKSLEETSPKSLLKK